MEEQEELFWKKLEEIGIQSVVEIGKQSLSVTLDKNQDPAAIVDELEKLVFTNFVITIDDISDDSFTILLEKTGE